MNVWKKQHRILTAMAVACAFCLLLMLRPPVVAEATEVRFPGMETIIENNKEKPLKILELVSDESQAELGFLVGGQEPFLKLEGYGSLEEGLAETKGFEGRSALAENRLEREDGSRKYKQISGDSGDGSLPLSFAPYEEVYKRPEQEGWTEVLLKTPETVILEGDYVPSAGGDYKKSGEETYLYAPGQGDYTFIEKEGELKREVTIGRIYYKGGYENHNWFTASVLHLEGEEALQFD